MSNNLQKKCGGNVGCGWLWWQHGKVKMASPWWECELPLTSGICLLTLPGMTLTVLWVRGRPFKIGMTSSTTGMHTCKMLCRKEMLMLKMLMLSPWHAERKAKGGHSIFYQPGMMVHRWSQWSSICKHWSGKISWGHLSHGITISHVLYWNMSFIVQHRQSMQQEKCQCSLGCN